MNRPAAAIAAAALLAAACGVGNNAAGPPQRPQQPAPVASPTQKPVPAAFRGRRPPGGMDLAAPATIAAGRDLYEGQGLCRSCHGDLGRGDGESGIGLDPAPTDLAGAALQAQGDDYIFWRIATSGLESGPPGTAMSGFVFGSEEQQWQLVAYVRSLKLR